MRGGGGTWGSDNELNLSKKIENVFNPSRKEAACTLFFSFFCCVHSDRSACCCSDAPAAALELRHVTGGEVKVER